MSKVCQLQSALAVEEQVCRLDIAVQHTFTDSKSQHSRLSDRQFTLAATTCKGLLTYLGCDSVPLQSASHGRGFVLWVLAEALTRRSVSSQDRCGTAPASKRRHHAGAHVVEPSCPDSSARDRQILNYTIRQQPGLVSDKVQVFPGEYTSNSILTRTTA